MWQNFTFLKKSTLSYESGEFWLLRCSTMVAREWPVCVRWFRIGFLLPRVKRAHPHVLWTLLSWVSLWSLSMEKSMGRVLRCSKWLLGACLIASQWSWDADWSSESMSPTPCLYDTVIQSYVQLKSGFYSFHGASYTLKVNGATLGRSCTPGVQLLPHFEVLVLQSLPASSSGGDS